MKIETITYSMLKSIMKLAINIDVELGFYISFENTITIDQYKNFNPNKTRIYEFSHNEFEDILRLVNAYAKLFNHHISIC